MKDSIPRENGTEDYTQEMVEKRLGFVREDRCHG